MARKRNAIILDKLVRESAIELESMVAELSGDKPLGANDTARPAHWSRRFAASGKRKCPIAPRLRAF